MFKRSMTYAGILLSVTLTGCAGLDTRLPDIAAEDLAAETAQQETEALRNFEADAGVLLNVGWPILTANTELCPKIRQSIGVKTHTLKSYPKRMRGGAARIFGADETPRIFHIADGSPAALAGVRRGDVIVDAAGKPAKLSGTAWVAALDEKTITIKRGEETLSLAIDPVMVCDYNLRLTQSAAINAYADGRNITMTTGMIDFAKSDNELALIIGHELGHNTMGHVRKSILNYIISFGGTRYTRPFESEADYVGLYYMARAGYSPQGVEKFWQRLASIAPKSIHRAKTHPTYPERYLRLKSAQDEIAAKQSAGQPLFPNFINGSMPHRNGADPSEN